MSPRRWLYVLGGLIGVLAIVLVVVLVTGDDDSDSASSTTTIPAPTTTAAAPTTTSAPTTATAPPTTAPPTSTPPTTLPLPPVTDDPQSYADFLFVAWQNGDRTAAAEVASADAVNQIFAREYSPQSQWTFATCNPAAGSLYCTWNGANGTTLVMTVRTITGGLPIQVLQVRFQTP